MLYRNKTLQGDPISLISFGGAGISGEGGGYGFGSMSEDEAEKLLKTASDAGITLFDTAPIYGFGLSEERMGKYLSRDAHIVTKGGVDWHSTRRVNMTNDPKVIRRMLEESLKRLKRDVIDVYMIHWPDPRVDIRRPMEVLQRAQEKGLIKQIGLCNTTLEELKIAEEIASIDVLQSELNVLNTKAYDHLQDIWKNKITMSWGTLDKGILSGRVHKDRTYSPEDARSWAPWWNKKEVGEKILRVEKLKSILVDYDYSLVQFCLNFNLYYYGIDTVLVGFKTEKDLVELSSNLQQKNNTETMKEILTRME